MKRNQLKSTYENSFCNLPCADERASLSSNPITETIFNNNKKQSSMMKMYSSSRAVKFLAAFLMSMALTVFSLQKANAQSVVVSGASTGNGTYSTLKAGFDAINAGSQTGSNIVITVSGTTTETSSAILNQSTGPWASLTIVPSGNATISGAITAGNALINLNGADNVTIDGLNNGSNSLTISNTTASATSGTSTIKLINDATYNVFKNAKILSQYNSTNNTTSDLGGCFWFSTTTITTGTLGNSNNKIENCDLTTPNGSVYTRGITSFGTATSAAYENKNDSVVNCNIYDYFSAAGSSAGIYTAAGSQAWVITGNRFYQTSARTQTTAGSTYGIYITNSANTAGGYTITGNVIGYGSSNRTGRSQYAGSVTLSYYGINFAQQSTGAASTISNNVISDISYVGTGTGTLFYGIYNSGTASTLTLNNDTIKNIDLGSAGTTSYIMYPGAGTTVSMSNCLINNIRTGYSQTIYLIYLGAQTTGTYNNNTIDSIVRTGNGSTYGFYPSGVITNYTVTNNTVSRYQANNASPANYFYCFYTSGACVNETYRNNTITNFSTTAVAANGGYFYLYGFYGGGGAGNKVLINNSITNINMAGTYGGAPYYGFYVRAAGTYDSIVNNKVNNCTTGNNTSSSALYGFYMTTLSATNYIYGNKISNLTGNYSTVYGLYVGSGTNTNVYNDTISNITNNYSAGAGTIYGAYIVGGTTNNFYNNYFSNLTNSNLTTSSNIYGTYISSGTTNNVYGNTYSNFTNAGTVSPTIHGLYVAGGTTNNVYQNTVNTLSNAGATSPVMSGIYTTGGTNNVIYRNKVYDLIDSANPTSTSPLVYGLWISGGGTGTAPGGLFYENVIGNLRAPIASNIQAIHGISVTSTASATYKIYNNTVSINASSAGTNFGTFGLYHAASTTATIAALDLRNNIINNNSTPSGTGVIVAYARSSGGGVGNLLSNYSANSNRNIFYAGVPSATNLIYADSSLPSAAVHTAQTLADYTSLAYGAYTIAPRDAASKTENTTFASTLGSASNYLSPATTAFTFAESGGASLGTGAPANFPWKVDYAGNVRQDSSSYIGYGTAPDIGAYEINNASSLLVLSDNPNGQVDIQNISANTTNNILHQAQLQVNYATNVLSSVSFVLDPASTYVSADITNFKLYYTTTNSFSTTNLLGTTTSASTGSGETVTFSGLNKSLTTGTYYLWFTADIPSSPTATVGNTLLINGMTASSLTTSTTGAAVSAASSTSASGLQTIANPCSGTPNPGTASSLKSNVCPNGTTTLSLTGTTVGTGITYEWHSSLDNFVTLDSAMGTNPSQITVPSSTLTYYYQCKVTCANSGQSNFSNIVTVYTYNTALSIAPNNNAQYCGYKNNPVQLTATTAGATPTSIVWTPIDSLYTNNPATTKYTLNTNSPTVYAAPAKATTYTATANYSGIGCLSTTASQTVTVGIKVTLNSVTASNNPVCAGNSSILSAAAISSAPYLATAITYNPVTPSGAATNLANGGTAVVTQTSGTLDEGYWSDLTLPFAFNYFGTPFTSFAVCTNGWMSFGAGTTNLTTTGYGSTVRPSTTGLPHNAIFGLAQDLNATSGSIRYYTNGTAPNRKFVIEWLNVPFYSAGGTANIQIILNEADQSIEIHNGAATNTTTVYKTGGVENLAGTVFVASTAGYNATSVQSNPTSATRFSIPVISYSWTPTTYLNRADTSVVTFTMPSSNPASQYIYSLKATESGGCYANYLNGVSSVKADDTLKLSTAAPTLGNSGNPTAVKNYATAILSNATVCPTNHVVLKTPTIIGGCAPYTYQWIKNDDGTIYSTKDSLAFDAVGNASVGTADYYYVNVTDVQGQLVQSQYFLLNITDNPFTLGTTPANAVICGTGSVTLSVSGYNGTPVFNWSPSTGLSATTGTSVVASPTSYPVPTTTYSVTSTLSGCVSPAKSVTVTVSPSPTGVVAASSAPSVCTGGSFNLTGSAASGGSINNTFTNVGYSSYTYYSYMSGLNTYGIQFNANRAFTLNTVKVYPYASTDGTAGTVTIALTNAAGTVLQSKTVNVVGYASANIGANGQDVNLGFTVPTGTGYVLTMTGYTGVLGLAYFYNSGNNLGFPFTDPSSSITMTSDIYGSTLYNYYWHYFWNWSITPTFTYPVSSYSWASTPSGFTSTSQNPTAVGLQSNNTTTYTVTVKNSNGCSTTGNVTVSLGGGTPSASAALVRGVDTGCYNRNVVLKASVTGGCSPFTYQWMLNGTPISNGGNIAGATSDSLKITGILANQAGNYSVKITDNVSANSTSSNVTISVKTPGAVNIAASQTLLCGNQTAKLTVTGGATGAPYTWTPISGLYVNGGNTAYTLNKDTAVVFVKLGATTTYTVSTVDNNGCTVVTSQTIAYGSNQTLGITSTASPLSVCAGNTSTLTSNIVNQLLANTYTFGVSTGATLDPMVNDTTICLANDDDTPNGYNVATTVGAPKNIGFTFYYEGTPYTQFSASPDAWIRLGSVTPSSSFTNTITTATQVPALIAYWDDLATGSDGKVSYVLTGTAPNRILKVNWKVTIPRNTTGASNSQFQIWLYETSNKVEYRYGTMGSATMSASVGLIGAVPTNFLSVSLATNTASITTANDNNSIQPASGTLYSFTPLAQATKVTWAPATAELSSSTGNPVTFTMPNSGAGSSYTYTATVTDTITGCYAVAATPVVVSLATGAPVISSITKSQSVVCKTSANPTTLTATITNGCAPYSYRWKLSGASTYFDSLINTNASTSSTIVNPTVTTDYVIDIVDNNGAAATGTNTVTMTVINPTPISTNGGAAVCGSGIPTVSAVSNSGNGIVWFDSLTNGNVLGIGNTYSPSSPISATTTYYAAENASGVTYSNVGYTSYTYYTYTTVLNTYGIQFDANAYFTLNSVRVYPIGASDGVSGTVTIGLMNAAGVVVQSKTVNVTGYTSGSVGNNGQDVNLGFSVAKGTGYKLVMTAYTGITGLSYFYNSGNNVGFPFTDPSNSITMTNSLLSGTSYNYYWIYFWNWSITPGCLGSTRLPAVATVTPRASIALSNNSQITTQTLAPGTNDNVVSTGTITVTNNSTTLSALSFNLTGNYSTSDISAFKLKLSSTNSSTLATTLGTNTSTIGGPETISFTGLNTALPIGTYYFWLTADVASGATINDSLKVSTIGSGGFTLTGCNNSITGTVSATGLQVITSGCFGTPSAVTFATPSYTACTGATAPTLTGTNNNGTISGYTYQWYKCDDAAGTNPVAISGANLINYKPANYTTAGTYYYYVATTCIFSSQTTNSAVVSVAVTYTPTVSLGVTPSTTICGGTSVTITDANNASGYTYSWTPNTSTTTSSTIVTPSVTTKYKVTSTNGACVGKADSVTITVTATPTVDSVRSSAAATCTGTKVNLKSYASAGGYVSTTQTFENAGVFPPTGWTLINAGSGNNWVSTTPTNHTTGGTYSMRYSYSTSAAANAWALTPAYNLVAGNTYTISVWYGSSYGGTSYNEKFDVTVGTAPTVAAQNTILFSSGNVNSSQSTWLNGVVTYSPTVTGTYYFGFNCNSITNQGYLELDDISISGGPVITGYSWASTPAGFSSSVQNPNNVTVASTGTNTYTVTATNNFGCTATGSVSVTGNPLPAAPTATNTGTSTCGTPTFTASSNSGVGSPVYAWYNSSNGTAVAGQTGSSYSPISFAVGNDTAYVSEVSTQGCLSPKTQSIVTVTTPDAFGLTTNSATICTNTSMALSVSAATQANYSTVTWSPITNLYTNAGLTIPYTTGANFSTVYVKPTTAGTITYLASASGSTGGNSSCVNTDTVRITAQAPIVVTTQPAVNTSTCGVISTTLSVAAVSTGTISYQWQSAVDSLSWVNVSNGTPSGTTYTGATTTSLGIATLNSTRYYRVLMTDGVCSNVGSNASLIFAGTPTIVSFAGDSTCQPTATLSTLVATPSTGASTKWYASSSSTTVLYNGTSYSTPALSTTTTYYAEPYVNYTTPASNVGYNTYTTYYGSLTGTSNYGIQFNVNNPIALNSVKVYPTASTDGTGGTITIQLKNSLGTVLNTATVNVVGYTSGNLAANGQTVNLGFTVPAGTGYQLVLSAYTGITGLHYFYNGGVNLGFPFADAANTISLTNTLYAGTSYNYYWMYFYNFNITPQYVCTGTRVAVTAKRTTAPSITVTGNTTNCAGVAATLSATSSNPGYKYTWRSNDGVTVLNGGSQTVNPSVTTAYSLTATDTTTGTYIGCFGSGSALVNVAQIPTTVTVNASPTQLCGGGTTGLTLTGGVSAGATILPEPFEISSPIFTNTSGASVSSNSTYFAQGSKSALITYGNGLSSSTAGTYELNQNIDLSKYANSGTDTVTLSFKQICGTEQGADYGYVEYSTNGGTTWTAFASNTYRGSGTLKNGVVSFDASSYSAWNTNFISVNSVPTNSLWKTETIKVPFAAYTSQFKFRFRVVSSASNVYYGWLIDDVKLTGGTVKRTFAWSNNTGATFTNFAQQSPNVSPTQTTTYNVVVSNSYGCTATAATPVTVTYLASSVQGTPTASVSTLCTSGNVTLGQTGGSLSAGAYWAWYTNASFASSYLIDTTSNPAATITKSISNTTTYYLRAEGTTTCSNTGGSSVTVTVNKYSVAPTSASVSNATICGSTSVTLTQNGGTLGAGATWKWYSDASFTTLVGTSSAANGSLATTVATTTTFYVRAEGATAPCTTSAVTTGASVTVNLVSNVQGTAQASATAVCNSGSVTLTQTGGSLGTGAIWSWYSDATFTTLVGTSAAANASLTTTVSSTKTFYVRAGGNVCGNTAGSSVLVTVNTSSVAPTSASASNPIICGSTIETLTQTGGSLGTGATWKWYSDASFTTLVGSSSAANATFATTVNATKTFYVRAEGATSPCSSTPSAAANVTVNLNSAVGATISGDYAVCQGASVPKTISIAFTGFGPWNVTYTDGTTPVTVNSIATSPYTFNVSPTSTKTYTVVSVNAGTGCNGTVAGSATYTVNAIPVATATPSSQNACSGSAININFGTSNNVSGGSFAWTRDNTSAATGIAASGSSFVSGTLTNTAGTSTVTFTVTPTGPAPTSCVGSPITATVTVYNPATVYNVTGGGAYCSLAGTGVPVGLSGSQSGYSYQLLYGNTSTTLLGSGNALAYGNQTTAGTYTVTASNAGCSTPMNGNAVVTITAPTTPSVKILASDTVVCGGTNAIFFAVATNGGAAPTYNFLVNGVSKQNGPTNAFVTNTLSNNDVVTCVMTSNASCQTTATANSTNSIKMTITSGATLAAPKSITGATTNCTVGTTDFLKDSTPGGIWRSSDTTVAKVNLYSGAIVSKKNGFTVIDYTINGSNGCKNSSAVVYTVAERSVPAAITTLAGSTSISVCQGGTTSLKSDTTGVWNTSSSSLLSVGSATGVVNGTTSTISGAVTGYVNFTATNSYGCSKTVSTPITVYGKPGVPTISYAPQYHSGPLNPQNGPNGSFCLYKNGVPNSFTVVGAGAAGSGTGTGVFSSSNTNVLTMGATSGLVTFVAAGNATISYTFTNSNGCTNSRSVAITVNGCSHARGIEYVAPKIEMDFTLYPNPAKGTVTVTADYVQSGGQIIVTDMLGNQVRKQALSLGANKLDISNLSKGFYFVNVVTSEGNKTKKLVIE